MTGEVSGDGDVGRRTYGEGDPSLSPCWCVIGRVRLCVNGILSGDLIVPEREGEREV